MSIAALLAPFLLFPTVPLVAQDPAPPVSELARAPIHPLGNLLLVDVKVAGGEPLTLLIDSGASSIVLDSQAADALELPMSSSRRGGRTSQGGDFGYRIAPTVGMELGGHGFELSNVLVTSVEATASVMIGIPVHGILGHPFLQSHVLEVNHDRGELVLHDPKTYRYAGAGAELPLRFNAGFANLPFVEATVEVEPGEPHAVSFLLDTGGSVLSTLGVSDAETAAAVIPPDAPRVPMLGATGLGDSAEDTMHAAFYTRGHRFQLGPHTIEAPLVSCSQKSGGAVNLFGAEALRRFHFVLDYERSRLILEPNAAFDEPTLADASGMFLVADTDDLDVRRIAFVAPGGPADLAGLEKGDELLTVNGEPARKTGLHALRLIFSNPGTYELEFRRGRETKQATLVAKSPF